MKRVLFYCLIMLLLGISTAWAAEGVVNKNSVEKTSVIWGEDKQDVGNKLPRVALLYINNAKTDYDAEIDAKIIDHIKWVAANRWTLVPGDIYKDKLASMGIQSITMAERADILATAKQGEVDALLLIEVEPFTVRDVMTFFTVGKKVTASIPVKAIDCNTGIYLYNGKFVELAQDNTMIGAIGNKSVSMKALDQIFSKFDPVVPDKFANVKRVEKNTGEK